MVGVSIGTDISFKDAARCEPDTQTLVAEAELVLRRSGIHIAPLDAGTVLARARASGVAPPSLDDLGLFLDALPHTFKIEMVGVQRETGTCLVSYRFSLTRREMHVSTRVLNRLAVQENPGLNNVPTMSVTVVAYDLLGVLAGSEPVLRSELRTVVNEKATELANEILKARRK